MTNKKIVKEELKEYYEIVKPILHSLEFKKRRSFLHHQDSVYDHSLRVSLCCYHLAKKLKPLFPHLSIRDATIAGLLHDFYSKPWREKTTDPRFLKKHGFTHAYEAAKNAYLYFPELMNEKVENAIIRHMFPLNRHLPNHIESWIVTLSDKIVSFEVLKHPLELPRYIGIHFPYQKEKYSVRVNKR